MKNKKENNKSKVIGFGILALLLTSAVVVTPILVKYFGKNNDNTNNNANTNIDRAKLESWTSNNTLNTDKLNSLLATNSKSLKDKLLNEGIISSEFANEIRSFKFVYSKNNYQLNSNKVKVDLLVETNDGRTNETV